MGYPAWPAGRTCIRLCFCICMFQDSVPAGSYNDPFLSSVCDNWVQLVAKTLMSTRCEDTIKIKNKKYAVLGQGNEHNFWLGPEFERQADFWAKFVEEADPWPLLFFFFSEHFAGNYPWIFIMHLEQDRYGESTSTFRSCLCAVCFLFFLAMLDDSFCHLISAHAF